jgi:hypothetical protein
MTPDKPEAKDETKGEKINAKRVSKITSFKSLANLHLIEVNETPPRLPISSTNAHAFDETPENSDGDNKDKEYLAHASSGRATTQKLGMQLSSAWCQRSDRRGELWQDKKLVTSTIAAQSGRLRESLSSSVSHIRQKMGNSGYVICT